MAGKRGARRAASAAAVGAEAAGAMPVGMTEDVAMDMTGNRPGDIAAVTPELALAETLDLREAAPLASALLANRGGDVTLDAAPVRRLGGQCLQVLLAAQASWLADGRALRIVNPSADFVAALTQFGAVSLLPQPVPGGST